jgi:hypothetical protein
MGLDGWGWIPCRGLRPQIGSGPTKPPNHFFFFNLCGGTLDTATTTGLLYLPRMTGDGDCGEIGGMKIGRGNRSSRRKPASAPLYPPQIPHD